MAQREPDRVVERSAWIRAAGRWFRRRWRQPGVRLALHIAGMLVLAVGVAWLLWLWMGQPRISSPYTRKEALEATKLVLAMVGGLGGVVFLTVAYRRQRTDEAAHQREEVASRREDTKLFNERFGAATEQLSSPEPANQLGGIYALAGLADDWEDGRQTCINVLCGYLRLPYTSPGELPENATDEQVDAHQSRSSRRQVRHALIDLIGERLRDEAGTTWQGHAFDLSGATIDGGRLDDLVISAGTALDFRLARFVGKVDFSGSEFSGGFADFSGAEFVGGEVTFFSSKFASPVEFENARFTSTTVDFSGSVFTDGFVGFSEAEFTNSEVEFFTAEFSGARVNFFGARFTGCHMAFGKARFTKDEIGFSYAEFTDTDADFYDAHFIGGQIGFDYATFSNCKFDFGAVVFSGTQIVVGEAKFTGCEVDFGRAAFTGGEVDFRNAAFSGGEVDFSDVKSFEAPPLFANPPGKPRKGLFLPPQREPDDPEDDRLLWRPNPFL